MSSSYDLLHGNQKSGYLTHHGTKGMQWGVRKDREALDKKTSGAGVSSSTRRTGPSSKTPTGTTLAKGGGSSAGEGEKKTNVVEAKTSEAIYSAAFAKALGNPPITPEKIAAATKAAEKAVEDADLEGEDGEGGEEEKKGKGAGPKDLEAEKKEKEKKKREKIAKDRAASSVLAKEMVDGMTIEIEGGAKRTPETLKREGLIIKAMLKQTKHIKADYAELEAIGARSFAESKGGKPRSAEQLKADSAFVKKVGDRFAEEADFIGNFGKKKEEQVKHEALDDFLKHYGTKGMRWGVRKDGAKGSSKSRNPIKRLNDARKASAAKAAKKDAESMQAHAKGLDAKAAALGKAVKANEAEFNRAAKANEVPNKHVRETSADTLNSFLKAKDEAKEYHSMADGLEAKSNASGKVRNVAKVAKEQHAKEVAFGRDRDVTILKTLGMNKAANAVAMNKSAGHALHKSVSTTMKTPDGKKAVAAGAAVVGVVLAGKLIGNAMLLRKYS